MRGPRSRFLQIEDNLNLIQIKNDLNIFVNGRQLQFFLIEDDMKIIVNWRWPQKKIMQPKTIKIETMVVAPLRVT